MSSIAAAFSALTAQFSPNRRARDGGEASTTATTGEDKTTPATKPSTPTRSRVASFFTPNPQASGGGSNDSGMC